MDSNSSKFYRRVNGCYRTVTLPTLLDERPGRHATRRSTGLKRGALRASRPRFWCRYRRTATRGLRSGKCPRRSAIKSKEKDPHEGVRFAQYYSRVTVISHCRVTERQKCVRGSLVIG